jgi:hypothetical protein
MQPSACEVGLTTIVQSLLQAQLQLHVNCTTRSSNGLPSNCPKTEQTLAQQWRVKHPTVRDDTVRMRHCSKWRSSGGSYAVVGRSKDLQHACSEPNAPKADMHVYCQRVRLYLKQPKATIRTMCLTNQMLSYMMLLWCAQQGRKCSTPLPAECSTEQGSNDTMPKRVLGTNRSSKPRHTGSAFNVTCHHRGLIATGVVRHTGSA